MSKEVLVQREGATLTITINRPQARNAVNTAVAHGIAAAIEELESNDDLTIGIITGAEGTFCSGMDLKAFLAGESPVDEVRGFAGICRKPPAKPVVAAVEGWALAGGCEIALSCDLIVAANNARFGIPEAKRGLVAAAGGLLRLPRRLPPNVAMELALTGDPLEAVDAHRFGLVNALTEPGQAIDGAQALAQRITANGPLAVAGSKYIVANAPAWSIEEGFEQQQAIVNKVMASDDAREGATAFGEKRAPVWTGR